MLKGIDISHHNSRQFNSGIINFNDHDFVIMKATEGKSFIDKMMPVYYADLMAKNKSLYGFYHFARPEYNDAITEAKFFCDVVGDKGNNAILVLDWEMKALKYPISWVLEWLKYVEKVYNKKPLIYCSSWYTKKLQPVLNNGNGLWVAHYTKESKPRVYVYPFYAIWQYTSKPYDTNLFNGDATQWLAYT